MAGNPYFMMPHSVSMQMQQPGMQGMQQMGPRPPYNLLRPTMPVAMPMSRPFMPMQMNSPPTVLRPPASLLVKPPTPAQNPSTIYVGRIPEDCEDEFITNILLTCGQVTKWKRLADPDSGKLKSFGFCEYDSPLSALRALRLLKNLEIDDSKLLLNVDTKTQEMLDAFDNAYKNSQNSQQDEAALLRIRQLRTERAIAHPPKPKEEAPVTASVPVSDEQNKEQEADNHRSSRKRDKGSRSPSREKRRKSRSRSKERSSRKRSSRDRRGGRSSRTRDRRRSRSRSRSRGRRDRKSKRHSRSRSPKNSESPKRKKKSKAKAKSDSEESGTEKENNQVQEDDSAADEEPPPPPPEDQNNTSETVEHDHS